MTDCTPAAADAGATCVMLTSYPLAAGLSGADNYFMDIHPSALNPSV